MTAQPRLPAVSRSNGGPAPRRRALAPSAALTRMRGLAAVILAAPLLALAQAATFSSPLSNLAEPRPGRAMHEGSWDRKGKNNDSIPVKPGETVTILNHEGAGCVHRFWVTISPRTDVGILSQVILRMYWDGDKYPSVECPIGAFFGVGFGEQKDYTSLPLNENSGGYNCYWPMPFHKSAQVDAHQRIRHAARVVLLQHRFHRARLASRRHPPFPRPVQAGESDHPGKELHDPGNRRGGPLCRHRPLHDGPDHGLPRGKRDGLHRRRHQADPRGDRHRGLFLLGLVFRPRASIRPRTTGSSSRKRSRPRISAYRWHVEDAIPFTEVDPVHDRARGREHGAGRLLLGRVLLPGRPLAHAASAAGRPASLALGVRRTGYAIVGAVEAEDLQPTAKATSGGMWAHDMLQPEDGVIWSAGTCFPGTRARTARR